MDYEKNLYFSKNDMSNQLSSTITSSIGGILFPESFSSYADTFDLSLLPADGEVPMSPNQSPFLCLDYLPTTIYGDHQQTIIKTEKSWNNQNKIIEENNIQNSDFSTTTTISSTTENSILFQQLQKQYQFYPSPLPSPPQYDSSSGVCSPASSTYSPSPCPPSNLEQSNFTNFQIKQEYLILPPSPPESQGSPSSPCSSEIKLEPDCETENLIDIKSLLEKSLENYCGENSVRIDKEKKNQQQDHQLLREYLQDTSFQKKHNLKPLALESLIGGLGVRGDIEPVISLALEHAKRDAEATCANLQISLDPRQWTPTQVHAWIRSTIEQFKLQSIEDLELKFPDDGRSFLNLNEDEFMKRSPESGSTIFAQLEIWRLACCDNFLNEIQPVIIPTTSSWNPDCVQNMDITDDEDEDLPSPIVNIKANTTKSTTDTTPSTALPTTASTSNGTAAPKPRTGGSHIHLWQFLKELLASPQIHGTAIRWLDRTKGVFKIEDSVRVAKLWGRRKNRPAMNYDKLSRSIRQYYKKGIMKKTERSQRLVYQFCHPYCL